MKHVPLTVIMLLDCLCSSTLVHAQTITIDSARTSADVFRTFNGADTIHLTAVKKGPEYSGGKTAWHELLQSCINKKIPFVNKAKPGTYRVMIRFIVGNDGKLRGIGADSSCGYGMESEVIRCIKKTGDWIPAETTSGKKVSYTLRTIVVFTVKPNDVIISFD